MRIALIVVMLMALSVSVNAASTGEQKTLAILVNFLDAKVPCGTSTVNNILFSDSNSVDKFFRESSYENVWFTGTSIGPYTINYTTDSTSNCPYAAWASAADNKAIAAGYNLSAYPRRVYVMPAACGYGGLGQVGGTNTRSWIFYCSTYSIYAHELGHNIAMGHANSKSSTGTITEYGDRSDNMGSGYNQNNAPHKDQMKWIPAANFKLINQSGIYSIAPTEFNPTTTALPLGLKIFATTSIGHYYLSYRRAIGFDSTISTTYKDKLNIHTYKSGQKTIFLNAISEGTSYTISFNGTIILVTPLNHDTNQMTVKVEYANGECLPANPTITLSPNLQTASAGTKLTYSGSIRNNDGLICSPTTFNLNKVVPPDWSGTLSQSTVTLNPGDTSPISLTVSSTPTAVAADYPVKIESSGKDSSDAGSGTATYRVFVDNIAPTAPGSLSYTSQKGKYPKIKLSWKASSDNIAVTAYQVYRNGVLIATVGGTILSYTDSGVTKGTAVTYYVIAKDGAGNTSPQSNTITV